MKGEAGCVCMCVCERRCEEKERDFSYLDLQHQLLLQKKRERKRRTSVAFVAVRQEGERQRGGERQLCNELEGEREKRRDDDPRSGQGNRACKQAGQQDDGCTHTGRTAVVRKILARLSPLLLLLPYSALETSLSLLVSERRRTPHQGVKQAVRARRCMDPRMIMLSPTSLVSLLPRRD